MLISLPRIQVGTRLPLTRVDPEVAMVHTGLPKGQPTWHALKLGCEMPFPSAVGLLMLQGALQQQLRQAEVSTDETELPCQTCNCFC